MTESIEQLIESALDSNREAWEAKNDAEKKLIKTPWEAISILSKRLNGKTSLSTDKEIIALMHLLSWRADTDERVPVDIPVEPICRCLEKHSKKLVDEGEDRIRLLLLMDGVNLLGKLNHPDSVTTLLMFVEPSVSGYDLSYDRLSEFALSSLRDVVGSASDNELHRKNIYDDELRNRIYLEQGVKDVIFKEIEELLGNGEDTKHKLDILRYLNENRVIGPMIEFMDSSDTECFIVLSTMHDQRYPKMLSYFEKVMEEEGPEGPLPYAIRIIGKEGGAEHVKPLIGKLRIYAKLNGTGYRNARDAVEDALVELREYSADILKSILSKDNNPKGFHNAIKRTLTKISEAENERPRSEEEWRPELWDWRAEKTVEEGKDFQFAVLPDDAILKIWGRQPLEYEELLDIDGIGAFKVNKYGAELLMIVRRNQPNFTGEDSPMEPWQLPIEMRLWLDSTIERVPWDSDDSDEAFKSQLMKEIGAHTKGQLRKLANNKFDSHDSNIVEKVLEMVMKTMQYEGLLVKAGQKRGVRYARLNRD